jgi:ATP-dependent Clp protease ATP-binding subunit ClpC
MTGTCESDVAALRRLAEELAKGRSERATTGHLLAAIASNRGGAAELLRERRLDSEVLLQAARVLVDDHADAVARAVQRAREIASRSPTREASGIHLLLALCQERTTAAYRAIAQCGSDVTKLRTAAMQLAMGLIGPRRCFAVTQLPLAPPSAPGGSVRAPARASPQLAMPEPKPALSPQSKARRARQTATATSPAKSALARFELDPKRTPTLCAIGRNLTLAAARGELDPVLGREAEIEITLDVLAKREGNCPCLVGPSGVGKTSIVRGLAQRIAEGRDIGALDDRVIVEIDAPSLLAGTAVRGALAERMARIRAEVSRAEGKVVLFFDEFHDLIRADEEAAADLKVSLARGELACITATTPEEYKRVICGDATLARRLSPVEITELSPEEAVLALARVAPSLARHHRIEFAADAIASAVAWTARYMTDRPLPDKAVGVLDLAGARARRHGERCVTADQVAAVVGEMAGVPVERLLETDGARMLRLEQALSERIVGHGEALARIARVLRRNAGGFRSRRPIGSFLMLGPTGVGKTETARAIAECLFHSPHAMTRLDLSEYAEAHAIARLVGAPPGYLGHEAGGQLTEAVRKRPYQVLLLDEIEKAHRDVLEAFLQVFDDGRMTDGRGRTVDFTNVVIVMTSNLGVEATRPTQRSRIGFGPKTERDIQAYAEAVCGAARHALPPELYNRIDEVIAFAPLGRSDVAEIARRMLRALGEDLDAARGVRLDATDAVVQVLLNEGGFDEEFGARPMRRAIGRLIEAPIAEMLLRGELDRGDVALVEVESEKIIIDRVRPCPRPTSVRTTLSA